MGLNREDVLLQQLTLQTQALQNIATALQRIATALDGDAPLNVRVSER